MISIRIERLTKRYGAAPALDSLDLAVEPGELFFLLGPSGCGKTTLLRCLAGFVVPDEGRILFGGSDVTGLAPHRRNTGMMFQGYALWPHMTVAENVAFGLEERRLARSEIRVRVGEALESVRMGEFAARRPNELSGGQQQRVALARALVVRPSCLLLDEPLSNLDAKLRQELRAEIRRVCKQFELTTVYVTHDQKEALSVSDRLAVLVAGRVLQTGTPREVYRRPVNRVVADFIGETCFLPGVVVSAAGEHARVRTSAGEFEGISGEPGKVPSVGSSVTLSIRPECWTLSKTPGPNRVRGRIGSSVFLGEVAHTEFVAGDLAFKILERNPRQADPTGGGELFAGVDSQDVIVLTA